MQRNHTEYLMIETIHQDGQSTLYRLRLHDPSSRFNHNMPSEPVYQRLMQRAHHAAEERRRTRPVQSLVGTSLLPGYVPISSCRTIAPL